MEINVNRFIQLLVEENKKQNLISRKAGLEEIKRHIDDSCALLEFMSLDGLNVVDVGSGAGFPGLILALYCPGANFTLLEADLKKSQFLQKAIDSLELTNVKVIRTRAETLGHLADHRENYDLCTSRAVAGMNILLEYSIPLIKSDSGMVAMWKGSNYAAEIAQAQNSLLLLNAKITAIHEYTLMEEGDRVIVIAGKEGPTSSQYPRRTGIPAKRPL
jgi:16S rRNA (guanine527-N7)-methyltransferase